MYKLGISFTRSCMKKQFDLLKKHNVVMISNHREKLHIWFNESGGDYCDGDAEDFSLTDERFEQSTILKYMLGNEIDDEYNFLAHVLPIIEDIRKERKNG